MYAFIFQNYLYSLDTLMCFYFFTTIKRTCFMQSMDTGWRQSHCFWYSAFLPPTPYLTLPLCKQVLQSWLIYFLFISLIFSLIIYLTSQNKKTIRPHFQWGKIIHYKWQFYCISEKTCNLSFWDGLILCSII